MEFEIAGRTYPAEYTVLTEELLEKHYGGVEKMDEVLQASSVHGRSKEISELVAALIGGGVQREKEMCKILGNEYSGPEAIDAETICVLMKPGQLYKLMPKIRDIMSEAYSTTTELEPEKGKNVKAAPSE